MANGVGQLQWFVDMLKREENEAEVGRRGSYWRPHRAPEDPPEVKSTIGYGHKLTEADRNFQIGDDVYDLHTDKVPHEVIEKLLIMDIIKHEKRAADAFSDYTPKEFKGQKWEDLNIVHRAILTEITFNAGLLSTNKKGETEWGWPQLTKAMAANNITGMMEQLGRFYVDSDGVKQPLTSRVKRMAKEYKKALKDEFPPSGTKGIAQTIKRDFPHFNKFNDFQKQKIIQRFTKEEEEKKAKEAEDMDFYLQLEKASEIRDRREADLMQEVEAEMSGTAEPPAPRTIDEGLITVEPLANVTT